ncbi:CDIPT [Branchiostoma lanceolatum]|uniref:CDP-diacylglycerol--inositol 3-phosphatidyltransferase n=1 Tax=Branchiostoma lanceolatum TaxID=7740 RepID=A0A8J9ZWI1_BRALA|nr:CDIPT [Branchiostoma lanceolatum]
MDNRDDNMGQYEVLTFVPNVIDYIRIVLLLVAYYHMPDDPVIGSFCYFSAVILDEVDGYAARLFNQCTRFGSQLDILVDLVGTCGLLTVLCMLYPRWAMVFQVSTALNISSHWMHFYSTTSLMRSATHKMANFASPLLNLYYSNSHFMRVMCIGNEACYIMLYLRYFTSGPFWPFMRVGLYEVLFYLCFPVALLKAYINCVQLQEAVRTITEVDMQEKKQAMAY